MVKTGICMILLLLLAVPITYADCVWYNPGTWKDCIKGLFIDEIYTDDFAYYKDDIGFINISPNHCDSNYCKFNIYTKIDRDAVCDVSISTDQDIDFRRFYKYETRAVYEPVLENVNIEKVISGKENIDYTLDDTHIHVLDPVCMSNISVADKDLCSIDYPYSSYEQGQDTITIIQGTRKKVTSWNLNNRTYYHDLDETYKKQTDRLFSVESESLYKDVEVNYILELYKKPSLKQGRIKWEFDIICDDGEDKFILSVDPTINISAYRNARNISIYNKHDFDINTTNSWPICYNFSGLDDMKADASDIVVVNNSLNDDSAEIMDFQVVWNDSSSRAYLCWYGIGGEQETIKRHENRTFAIYWNSTNTYMPTYFGINITGTWDANSMGIQMRHINASHLKPGDTGTVFDFPGFVSQIKSASYNSNASMFYSKAVNPSQNIYYYGYAYHHYADPLGIYYGGGVPWVPAYPGTSAPIVLNMEMTSGAVIHQQKYYADERSWFRIGQDHSMHLSQGGTGTTHQTVYNVSWTDAGLQNACIGVYKPRAGLAYHGSSGTGFCYMWNSSDSYASDLLYYGTLNGNGSMNWATSNCNDDAQQNNWNFSRMWWKILPAPTEAHAQELCIFQYNLTYDGGVTLSLGDMIDPSLINNPPTVSRLSQVPPDLNLFNGFGVTAITYLISDADGIDDSFTRMFWKINNSVDNYAYILNGTGYEGYFDVSYDANASNNRTWYLDDNDIYFGLYNIDESLMENTTHGSDTLDTNDYIKVEILNVTSAKNYSILEAFVNTSGSQSGRFYYCNTSYTTGHPDSDSNCVNFYNLDANQAFNHTHPDYSYHHVIPFLIDSGGKINGIQVTPTSYFLLEGRSTPWYFWYITKPSRPDAMQKSTDNGASWVSQDYTVDMHLHQYSQTNDSLYYRVQAKDSTGLTTNSTIFVDNLDILDIPPTAPIITYPTVEMTYIGFINITYEASTPATFPIWFYNITLVDTDELPVATIVSNNSLNLDYYWNSSTAPDGTYIIKVLACDSGWICSAGLSTVFSLENYDSFPYYINFTSPGDIYIGNNASFSIIMYDDRNLSSYTFQENMTNSNLTVHIETTKKSATISKTVLKEGMQCAMFYMNDTAGQENMTSLACFNSSASPELNQYNISRLQAEWFSESAFQTNTTSGVMMYFLAIILWVILLGIAFYTKIPILFALVSLLGIFMSFLLVVTISVIIGVIFLAINIIVGIMTFDMEPV